MTSWEVRYLNMTMFRKLVPVKKELVEAIWQQVKLCYKRDISSLSQTTSEYDAQSLFFFYEQQGPGPQPCYCSWRTALGRLHPVTARAEWWLWVREKLLTVRWDAAHFKQLAGCTAHRDNIWEDKQFTHQHHPPDSTTKASWLRPHWLILQPGPRHYPDMGRNSPSSNFTM